MNLPDEELQNRIEKGDFSDDSMETKAYQKVFAALEQEPFVLDSKFADRVIGKLENRSIFASDYFWFGLGLSVFLMAAIITAYFSNFRLDLGILKIPSGYKGLALFGLAFVLLLHYLDKQLIHRRTKA